MVNITGRRRMSQKPIYPNKDMEQTGKRLKYLAEAAGYTPRMLQEYLHLSCVQPIYRWYKGVILPSVDHLLMLSELLNVHMEDLLVKKNATMMSYDIEEHDVQKRWMVYYKKIYQTVA